MNIVLIGSGNVATHLGRAFKMAGQTITQVWSRDSNNAAILADSLGAEVVADISDLQSSADLYILAVSDIAIREVASRMSVGDSLVVHTSGTTALGELTGVSPRIGVLHPLQTFSQNKSVDFRTVPIAIEGNSPDVTAAIRSIAERLSERVQELDSRQRMGLHIAAVFACNFTNHLYTISKQLLEKFQLEFDLVRPLIAETANKVQTDDPGNVQTGPASRGDETTVDKHLRMLSDYPDLRDLYAKLSESISNSSSR